MLRELMCVDEDAVVRAPAHFDPAEAATLPIAGVTASQALFADDGVTAGRTVAVQGSGGVSLFVVQLARAAGVRMLSFLRGSQRRDVLERLGAEVFDSTLADWPERVASATAGPRRRSVRGRRRWCDAREDDRCDTGGRQRGAPRLCRGTSVTLDLLAVIRRAVTLRAVSGGSRTSFEQLVHFPEMHRLSS